MGRPPQRPRLQLGSPTGPWRRAFTYMGTVTSATAGGSIERSNFMEDFSVPTVGYPWYWSCYPWWWTYVNPLSVITRETTIRPGQSVTVEYDWQFLHRP